MCGAGRGGGASPEFKSSSRQHSHHTGVVRWLIGKGYSAYFANGEQSQLLFVLRRIFCIVWFVSLATAGGGDDGSDEMTVISARWIAILTTTRRALAKRTANFVELSTHSLFRCHHNHIPFRSATSQSENTRQAYALRWAEHFPTSCCPHHWSSSILHNYV